MADNVGTGVQVEGRTSAVSDAANIAGIGNGWIGNIYTYQSDLQAIHEKRTEVYDIGAVDSPFRVQGMDTYTRQAQARSFDVDAPDAVPTEGDNGGRVLIKGMADKRKQFEHNVWGSKKRMRALDDLVGKRLICSQCTDRDGKPECDWHMSAVGNVQVKAEILIQATMKRLKAEGRLDVEQPTNVQAKAEASK